MTGLGVAHGSGGDTSSPEPEPIDERRVASIAHIRSTCR